MGQILSSPITTKHTTQGKDERLMYGASSMQGWRITMEDAHTHILHYEDTGAAFFAVYDGHGGSNVAKYSSQQLQKIVIDSEDFKGGRYEDALRNGFLQIDSDLRQDPTYEQELSGSTAIVCLLTKDNELYVSNAGDSRAIICTDGVAVALSEDHKPSNPKELERITLAGGHVEFGRVNGNLALSRALGDFEFKKNKDLSAEDQAVTADPDIIRHNITVQDEFMVLACDGIWDCLSNQQVATFIRQRIALGVPLGEICEQLMDSCLAETTTSGIGCDNMTVEIVAFLHGQTEEEWYEKMKHEIPPSESDGEPELKKHRSMKPESRQYTAEELRDSADLAESLTSPSPTAEEDEESEKNNNENQEDSATITTTTTTTTIITTTTTS